ncbi:hypothetical protein ACIGPN_39665 [Streptomyces afghaniensis]|uniref:hypothetical protein n=1 Tax=Streptomyces afghaniensis TaxID=66865 RepID=UPI0037D15ABB
MFGLDNIAERIGEALRQQPANDRAEQAVLTAFRSARTANDKAGRTRRRDDWRPRTQKQRRWARGGALALAVSTLLGGIAVASIGVVHGTQHHAPDSAPAVADFGRPQPSRADRAPPRPPGPRRHPKPPPPSHPGTAKDIEAHCHAYERIKGRGHSLNATAWQRLVRAAGGEQQVAGYCAQLIGSADDTTPTPTKANKAKKTGKTKNANKTGKDLRKSSAETKPSRKPTDRH